MNCQQICKISRRDLTEVKILQKLLGGYFFLKHPVQIVHKSARVTPWRGIIVSCPRSRLSFNSNRPTTPTCKWNKIEKM